MFTEFIARILGAERNSVSNRLEIDAAPSVTARKDSTEKYQKDIAALEKKYDKLSSQTGLSINLTLKEALALMPRGRKRIDAYSGLISHLKREYDITLTITSQKSKPQ